MRKINITYKCETLRSLGDIHENEDLHSCIEITDVTGPTRETLIESHGVVSNIVDSVWGILRSPSLVEQFPDEQRRSDLIASFAHFCATAQQADWLCENPHHGFERIHPTNVWELSMTVSFD